MLENWKSYFLLLSPTFPSLVHQIQEACRKGQRKSNLDPAVLPLLSKLSRKPTVTRGMPPNVYLCNCIYLEVLKPNRSFGLFTFQKVWFTYLFLARVSGLYSLLPLGLRLISLLGCLQWLIFSMTFSQNKSRHEYSRGQPVQLPKKQSTFTQKQ